MKCGNTPKELHSQVKRPHRDGPLERPDVGAEGANGGKPVGSKSGSVVISQAKGQSNSKCRTVLRAFSEVKSLFLDLAFYYF